MTGSVYLVDLDVCIGKLSSKFGGAGVFVSKLINVFWWKAEQQDHWLAVVSTRPALSSRSCGCKQAFKIFRCGQDHWICAMHQNAYRCFNMNDYP